MFHLTATEAVDMPYPPPERALLLPAQPFASAPVCPSACATFLHAYFVRLPFFATLTAIARFESSPAPAPAATPAATL